MIERVANDHNNDGKFRVDVQYNNYNDEVHTAVTATTTVNVNRNANEKDHATTNRYRDNIDGAITTERLMQVPSPTFAPSPFGSSSTIPSTIPNTKPTWPPGTPWPKWPPATPWPTLSPEDIAKGITDDMLRQNRQNLIFLGIAGGFLVLVVVGLVIRCIVGRCRGRSPGRIQHHREVANVTGEDIPTEESVVGFAVAVAIPAGSHPTATPSGSATPNNHYPTAYATSQDTVG